jgi:nitroreductase
MSKKRNMPKESLLWYRDVMIQTLSWMSAEQRTGWMQKQVYLALWFLLAQAAHMHIDACPMEGFVPEEFDRVLDLGEYQSVVICPIWYRSQDDKYAEVEKVRYSSEEVIEWR